MNSAQELSNFTKTERDSKVAPSQFLRRFVALFAGACVVYGIAISPFRPWDNLVGRLTDDAAYYFQIGRNYADGVGLTFDGRNPTNGFQPLWQALIALMQQMPLPFGNEPEQFARTVLLFQAVLLAAALVIFNRTLRFLTNEWLRVLGTVLFLVAVFLRVRNGMESALLIFLAAVALNFHAQSPELERWNWRRCVGFGALLGCILLARLDSIFWVIGIFTVLVLMAGNNANRNFGMRLRKSSWIGITCAAVLIPYLAGNYFTYGRPMPISGALKSSFPVAGYHPSAFRISADTRILLILSVILSVACLVWELGPWRKGEACSLRVPACAMAIGVLLHSVYAVLFMKWDVFSWHFVLERFAVCLLVPYLCSRMKLPFSLMLQRWAIGATAVMLACVGALTALHLDWRSDASHSWTRASYYAAQWVKANLPDNAVLAMSDSGVMGFYSGRPVVNLDGLVNSFSYQEMIKQDRFREFLRDNGVTHIVQVSPPEGDVTNGSYVDWTFHSYSHLYDRRGDDVVLTKSQEVYRSHPYYGEESRPAVLVIWALTPEDLGGEPPNVN